jgi:uncharacterized phage protein (TIGR01671 family)
MNREIEFRGLNDTIWYYGEMHYNAANGSHQIVTFIQMPPSMLDPCGDQFNDFNDVKYSTIGQYTGVMDRKGVKIYEGDIVACKNGNTGSIMNCEVVFHNGCFCTRNGSKYNWRKDVREFVLTPLKNYVLIVGNIHQNPELINI